jgi:hypothetical protein
LNNFFKFFRPKILGLEYFDLESKFRDQLSNTSAKLAFYIQDDFYTYLRYKTNKSGIVLQQKLYTFPLGVSLSRNNFLLSLTAEVTRKLNSFGINKFLWIEIFKEIPQLKFPEVLSVDDLSFGFIIWWISCGISFIVYLCELFYVLGSNLMLKVAKNVVGLSLLMKLLSWRLKSV